MVSPVQNALKYLLNWLSNIRVKLRIMLKIIDKILVNAVVIYWKWPHFGAWYTFSIAWVNDLICLLFVSIKISCDCCCLISLWDSMACSMPGSPFLLYRPEFYSDSCPLSQWCYLTFSSSVIPFSSCLQTFPASGSFPMSHFLTSGEENIGASVSIQCIEYIQYLHRKHIQGWSPLEWTGLSSLQSKGLSRVFNTTVQSHQFFSAQPSSWSNSHIPT